MYQIIDYNSYISYVIIICLSLYICLLRYKIHPFIINLFKNTIFKIFILFVIVYEGNKDPTLAIIIAIAYVLTLDYIYLNSVKETFVVINRYINQPPNTP
jgi:hypothetical protein